MTIKIANYFASQEEAMSKMGNRQIQAFVPATFMATGYPHSVQTELDILKYVDAMHEKRIGRYSRDYYTVLEVELIQAARATVERLSGPFLDYPITPLVSPLAQLSQLRLFRFLELELNTSLKVFEIGGGSGYFGYYLLRQGAQYYSTDNSAGFYLWQNRLFNECTDGGIVDLGDPRCDIDAINRVGGHIPWWVLAESRDYDNLDHLEVDVIVASGVLREMTRSALRFSLNKLRRPLQRSRFQILMAPDLGAPTQISFSALLDELETLGWLMINQNPYLFVTADSELAIFQVPRNDRPRSIQHRIWAKIASKTRRQPPDFWTNRLDTAMSPTPGEQIIQGDQLVQKCETQQLPFDFEFMAHADECERVWRK